jgi:3-dehydroquinate synthase
MTEKVRVELRERSYDIVVGSGILPALGEQIKRFGFTGVAVISNPTVYAIYGPAMDASLRKAGFNPVTVMVPDGEEFKNLQYMEHIWGELLKQKLDRKSALIALGGGVIGDMAGFAASAYMRGIAYVQAPTTLLAQVDSSVGGKTGVNHPLGKNMIGAFHQPSLVWIDIDTLKSLPRREFLAGLAEVIKYGVIWDEVFFNYLEANGGPILALERDALINIIRRSCQIKAEVVSKDEREGGLRAILNYGHTVGHAIETVTGYKKYLHGEAVAIGMCEEVFLSKSLGFAGEEAAARIRKLVESYGLPSEMPPGLNAEDILAAMAIDKKALAGVLRFVLPERVGRARVNEPVSREDIERLLKG